MEASRVSSGRVMSYWFGGASALSRETLEKFAEASLLLSPRVALRHGEAIFLDGGKGVAELSNGRDWAPRLQVLARKFGLNGKIIEAPSVIEAVLLEKFGSASKGDLPLSALFEYFDPFGLETEASKKRVEMERFIHALSLVGVKTLKGLLKIPPSSLAARFGSAALEARRRVFTDRAEESWPVFQLAEKICESKEVECVDLEGILFVLKGLLDHALARVLGRSARIEKLQIEILSDHVGAIRYQTKKMEFEFPIAQGTVGGMLPILRERLAYQTQKEPFLGVIQKISLEVLKMAPGRGAQRDFFNHKEEEGEARESLLARLIETMGENSVFSMNLEERHCPERAFQKRGFTKESADAGAPSSKKFTPALRPSRILFRPELLRNMGPLLMRNSGERWKVKDWNGPERINGEWWESEGSFDRDYYRVLTEEGRLLWVFTDRQSGRVNFYLQGFFD